MIVGFLRKANTPGHMAKLLAIMCKHEGIDLVYFTPENVSIETGKINGKMLIHREWINVETNLPKFIDINPNFLINKKYHGVMKYLKSNTLLSSDKRVPLPKDELYRFKNDPYVSRYLIPTENIESMENIKSFVDMYEKVVIKPIRSSQGKNVFILAKEGSKFVLGKNKEEKILSEREFENFFWKQINSNGYIVQKYITSRNKQGDPFDCRIHVEKNGKGKWANPRNFIRIGVGQKVISNVNQGGGISNIRKFLKSNYGHNWEVIYNEIRKLAQILPYKIEEMLKKKYMTFGFDIGIDEKGDLYIFEVNSFPIVSPMKSEIAMVRSRYYKYVLENNAK